MDGESGNDDDQFFGDTSGSAVSLSDNGHVVVIGAPRNDGGEFVRIFDISNTT
jgi:hypothetical protein